MSESQSAGTQALQSPSPPPEPACWVCRYLEDQLATGSGASDLQRDMALLERRRHMQGFHPGEPH
jgi:hypothetical protein